MHIDCDNIHTTENTKLNVLAVLCKLCTHIPCQWIRICSAPYFVWLAMCTISTEYTSIHSKMENGDNNKFWKIRKEQFTTTSGFY